VSARRKRGIVTLHGPPRTATPPAPWGRPQCHYAGQRDYCERVAVGSRGPVPLCGECERRASSLTRLPRESEPAATPAAVPELHNAVAAAQAAEYAARLEPVSVRVREPIDELRLICRAQDRLAAREALAVKSARRQGLSWPQIAEALGQPLATVHRHHRDRD
jgi:hypothetical protein